MDRQRLRREAFRIGLGSIFDLTGRRTARRLRRLQIEESVVISRPGLTTTTNAGNVTWTYPGSKCGCPRR